jgi:ArsR family transcriptional regulator, arsenate/arsenite/antimonite-responsive transcriptional repressor / arsenate reductase (thioredoxin)
MNAEWPTELRARARVHGALREPARLAIVERLVVGDASPSELGRELGLSSNLLAHHLNLLEAAELLERVDSEGDQRRRYVRLHAESLSDLVPAGWLSASRVVFVCTQNSARSQLAAAVWAERSQVPGASAGTRPASRIHPQAVSVARRHGLSLGHARTSHVDDVLDDADLVVAVCDNAHEQLGSRALDRLHWSVPDPARDPTPEVFERVFDDISTRIDRLAPAVHHPGDTDA